MSKLNEAGPRKISPLQPLGYRNFRLLWFGSILSFLSAQLTIIAFPWLVLRLSGDALIMGAVLATAGVPRAIFMAIGGAFTDRFSAVTVMKWTNAVRFMLMFLLTYLVWSDTVGLWMIFAIAFLFGTADAFYWPASTAIIPKLVPTELLPPANALMQGLGQLTLMVGPVLAGIIIVGFSGRDASPPDELFGISMVFFIDGLALLVSLVALSFIRIELDQTEVGPFSFSNIATSMSEGFSNVWNDKTLRIMAIVFALLSLIFRGPYMVGIPVLADTRFEEGALAFGLIGSSFGIGALVGLLVVSYAKPLQEKYIGLLILINCFVLGMALIVYAYTPSVQVAMLFSAISGSVDGYLTVVLISWIQRRVAGHLLGRVMSIVMMASVGLVPISAAVAGALISWSLEGMFLGGGILMLGLVGLGLLIPDVRQLGRADSMIESYSKDRLVG